MSHKDESVARQTSSKKPKPAFLRIAHGVVIVLAVVAGLFIVKYNLESRQIKEASRASSVFATALINNNAHVAYQITSPFFQQYTTEGKLSEYTQSISRAVATLGDPKLNISSQTGPFTKLHYVTIIYPVSGPNGQGEIEVVLEKLNSKWLVRAFEIKAL